MRVAAVISDLMLFSRIDSAARAAGASLVRVDSPADLSGDLDVALVDWSARDDSWADLLADWARRTSTTRLILFGPHTDMDAHSAARAAGLGPVMARSKLVADLDRLLR